jgi:hypothetical protein
MSPVVGMARGAVRPVRECDTTAGAPASSHAEDLSQQPRGRVSPRPSLGVSGV